MDRVVRFVAIRYKWWLCCQNKLHENSHLGASQLAGNCTGYPATSWCGLEVRPQVLFVGALWARGGPDEPVKNRGRPPRIEERDVTGEYVAAEGPELQRQRQAQV